MSESIINNEQIIWSSTKEVLIKFLFLFTILFILVMNNSILFFINIYINQVMHIFTPWFAEHILHYKYDYGIFSNGSGDTSYDWVNLIIILILTIILTFLWQLMPLNKKINNNNLYYTTITIIRYYVGYTLLIYGIIKLNNGQFPEPNLLRQTQRVGEMSPMGIVWTFYGISKGYGIFMAIIECSAILLFFKRTYILGSLLALATTVQIVSINYFYDVPVKLFSTVLLLLTITMLLPNIKKFYILFLKQQSTSLVVIQRPLYNSKWKNKLHSILKYGVIIFIISYNAFMYINRNTQIQRLTEKSSLYGVYLNQNNQNVLPSSFKTIIFQYKEILHTRNDFNKISAHAVKVNNENNEITIKTNTTTYALRYHIQTNGDLVLTEKDKENPRSIILQKMKHDDFPLLNTGFRWISEYPYNR